MAIRLLGSLGTVAALIGVAVLVPHPVAGQEQGAAPPLVITAFGDKSAPPYAVGPHIVGRTRFAGRVVERRHRGHSRCSGRSSSATGCISANEEYADRAKHVESGVERAENEATSSFRQDFARRAFWQTSLIVDPADGRMPAYTRRRHEAAHAARHVRQRTARQLHRLLDVRTLHHARYRRLVAARGLRQRTAHRASARRRGDLVRDDSRHAPPLYRRSAPHQPSDTRNTSGIRARIGKATSSSSKPRI